MLKKFLGVAGSSICTPRYSTRAISLFVRLSTEVVLEVELELELEFARVSRSERRGDEDEDEPPKRDPDGNWEVRDGGSRGRLYAVSKRSIVLTSFVHNGVNSDLQKQYKEEKNR